MGSESIRIESARLSGVFIQKDSVITVQAEKAGATIVKRARKTFWGGYAGYFADPDGHLWEVAFNPSLLPENDSRGSLH